MNIKAIIMPKIPRLLALVGLGLTMLVSRHLVSKFGLSPEMATLLSDYVAEAVLAVALLGIGALKLGDNRKVEKLLTAERVKVAQAIVPKRVRKPAAQEDNRG